MSVTGEGETILVVDDDYALRHSVQEMLHERGYHVLTAANGAEALSRFYQNKVDLVLTDLVMRKMDGAQLTHALQTTHPAIPVIVMSGEESKARFHADGLQVGARGYLGKPLDAEEVIRMIEAVLTRADET